MKKKIFAGLAIVAVFALVSWGPVGHRTVATIAYNHLTPQAKAGIRKLIGDTSLADISTWADEVRSSNPAYASTAPWHFLNLKSGYTYDQFADAVSKAPKPNVYTALQKCEADLKSDTTSPGNRAIALKFVVHLVGDLHQPMHVSHAEDLGGNRIQVKLFDYQTNLHSVWDSGLLRQHSLTLDMYAAEWDKATPQQIATWQHDDMLKWLYESYVISEQIYADVAKNPNLGDKYYNEAMPIVAKRIEQGGIRLAGVLNDILK